MKERAPPVDWTTAPMGKGKQVLVVVALALEMSASNPSLGRLAHHFFSTQSGVNFSCEPSQLLV